MARVLVVDDDADIRAILALSLSMAGHHVVEAGNGGDALAAMDAEAPDCVVLDLMMPNVDGFFVLRARRERELAPDARFLVLSARTAEKDFLRGFELGADDYLTKPFDNDALVAKVGELLAASPAELAARRTAELEKAQLLHRVDSAFEQPEA